MTEFVENLLQARIISVTKLHLIVDAILVETVSTLPDKQLQMDPSGCVFTIPFDEENTAEIVLDLHAQTVSVMIEETAHNDRVVDVTAFTALAKSARVHLTENGSMLFSYTMDNKVYNHQMTDEERQKLDSALTNGDLSTKEQMKQIASVFSGISINTNVANKFDNDMSVSQNVRNSMQR